MSGSRNTNAGPSKEPDDGTRTFHAQGQSTSPKADTPSSTESSIPIDLINHPRYSILEHVGSGGMGTVYKARHRIMDRLVALKIINLDLANRPVMVERFRREVRAAARLSHPNIVTAFDADQAGDTHFLIMEFVEGVDLDCVLKQRVRLASTRACDYARQAALGMQHAWECGMVHRDIKPHNLMLTPGGQIKILDFGLARFLSEIARTELGSPAAPVTEAEWEGVPSADDGNDADAPACPFKGTAYAYTGGGTADYIAPEEVLGARRADVRADIYSLGCTLYRFLSGSVPFPDGDLMHKVRSHVRRTPEPLGVLRPDSPPRLDLVVARMMAKEPAERFQTPAAVAEALTPFAVETPRPILVVDDDALTRAALAVAFESRGYPTAFASNGQEALDSLRRGVTPCLILLDLMMPVMDGWEFLQRQKEDPVLSTIPVVIVSAADCEQAQVIARGAAECLRKPLVPEEVTAKVREHASLPQ